MKFKLIISLIFCLGSVYVSGQNLRILFTNQTIDINKIEHFNALIKNINDQPDQPVIELFYKYNSPKNFEEYKSCFLEDEYPFEENFKDVFDEWRSKMGNAKYTLKQILHGTNGNNQYAIIPFELELNGSLIRSVFFAKRINGKWIVFNSQELREYAEVEALLAIINPEFLLDIYTNNKQSKHSKSISSILKKCSFGEKEIQISKSCILEFDQQDYKKDPRQHKSNSDPLFLKRMIHQNEIIFDQSAEYKLNKYLSKLELSPSLIEDVNYYFSRGEWTSGIEIIRVNSSPLESDKISKTLNEIMNTSHFKYIEFSSIPKE